MISDVHREVSMTKTSRLPGFRGEFLGELDIATNQIVAMAEAVPPADYSWRPSPKTRSISEVFVHVAAGGFMLMDIIGVPAPTDLYGRVPAHGQERFVGLIRRNDELEATLLEKDPVVATLRRSLQTVKDSFTHASDTELNRPQFFFGENTTVRRVYMRLLSHTHEHMGQMIAYLRFSGLPLPWPDWRPDRRASA
jgi:uncharacterized damage-inducible protein DinB